MVDTAQARLPHPTNLRLLHREHRRAGGPARCEVGMRLRRVAQRIGLVDLDLDGAFFDDLEQLVRLATRLARWRCRC